MTERVSVAVSLVDPTEPGDLAATVADLAAAATRADGVEPLAEAALLRLRHPDRPALHLLARDSATGRAVGYLGLAPGGGEPATEAVAEAVVHPEHRRLGVGTALIRHASDLARTPHALPWPGRASSLRAWAHGDLPAAAALAERTGMRRDRILLRLRWSAEQPLPPVEPPPDVGIRTFRPGADDDAWVAVNARAFAGHPEQGYVGLADLRERMAEDWFDPGGFFLAERVTDHRLVGFHWTKVHTVPERVGEVYVVGVDPVAQGTGLGRTLTVVGLAHLVSLGLPAVILYADESNAGAVRLYERLGFVRDKVDVEYAMPLGHAPLPAAEVSG